MPLRVPLVHILESGPRNELMVGKMLDDVLLANSQIIGLEVLRAQYDLI